jgi:non-specific serine/threonine protein kinase
MDSSTGNKAAAKEKKKPFLGGFLAKLRKRHIIETLAAFIGGGWLLVEVVERLLVGHYKFPEESIDLTVISVIGALLATLVWRWFGGTEKRPGNIKIEVLLVPLIILATLSIDLTILLRIIGISGKTFLIAAVAVCLGIAWIILKSLQWAAAAPVASASLIPKPIESSSPASGPPEKSIVVLPFVNISPEEGQEYFCDGMTEEIIADLSHVHELLVISRSSAMTFKGSSKTIRDIAKDLNIRYVLEGSVRKAGNDLRITAQLIDATTDAHVWAEKYVGTLDDVFAIQEKVSRSIADALKLKLTPEEKRRMAEQSLRDTAAYECYLKGMAEIWRCQEHSLELAVRYFQQGLEIAGGNALLNSGMAYAYWQYVNLGLMQDEGLAKAEELVGKALALAPEFPKAHAVSGWIGHLGGKFQDAVFHFKQALAGSPDDPFALQGLAGVYVVLGKTSVALPLSERLMRIDPLDFITNFLNALQPFYGGDFELALVRLRKVHERYPDNPYARFGYALLLAYYGRREEAFALFDLNAKDHPDLALAILGIMFKHAILGEKKSVFKLMTDDLRKTCLRDSTYGHHLAGIFALLGERSEALDWLGRAVTAGFINYPLLADKDPFLANIRGEERFKKLMKRVKYEWEHFEV